MSDDWKQQLLLAHAQGDYAPLLQMIPYAGLIGVECSRVGDDLLFKLPATPPPASRSWARPPCTRRWAASA